MQNPIPVSDPGQKSREFFLYWLSLSETQSFLRSELGKMCPTLSRTVLEEHDLGESSPQLARAASPPPINTSKSPRSSVKAASSPRRKGSGKSLNFSNSSPAQSAVDETDGVADTIQLAKRKLEQVPRFYYPDGREDESEDAQKLLQAASAEFKNYPNGYVTLKEFPALMKACKLPVYWKAPLFKLCCGANKSRVDLAGFRKTWTRLTQTCNDAASRFVYLLTQGKRKYLLEEDFATLLQDIVDTHPGLACLNSAPEFHSRYIETVTARIFYTVAKSWNFKITISELRKSSFLEVLADLDKNDDINQELEYFSYEHFYVIYCKFWDIDTDHNCIIDADDLSHHANGALLPTVVKRLMSGAVTRKSSSSEAIMSYKDFVWFLISEEDKTTSRSIEYWFRCMDIDGDGVLSLYELELFYIEMVDRMNVLGIEALPVEDFMCQVLDMVNPKEQGKITIRDLKNCRMTTAFFNMCCNVEKYCELEQDPLYKNGDEVDGNLSHWERFAQEQYQILSAEEEATYDSDEDLNDDDRAVLS